MITVNNLNLGSVDGRNESEEPNFSEMFYNVGGFYDKLNDTKSFIISGRKGTGKTTLASFFVKQADSKTHISCQLFSNDYIENKLLEFSNDIMSLEEQTLFCEYNYYFEIGKQFIKYYNSLFPISIMKFRLHRKIQKLKTLISKEQMKIENKKEEYSGLLSNNIGYKISNDSYFGSDISSEKSSKKSYEYMKTKYYQDIDALRLLINDIFNISGVRMTIFYDDMDQLEEYMERNNFLLLMLSFIYAAEKINKSLYNNYQTKICLILRDDIIDQLQPISNNLNKIVVDLCIKLDWTSTNYDSPWVHPLMKMVIHKIRINFHELKNKSDKEIYNRFFEETVFNLIMKNSFGRPRDIISYLKCYIEKYPSAEIFTLSRMKDVEKHYSKLFYDEFINELKMSEKSDQLIKLIEYIVQRGYPTFSYSKIDKYLKDNSLNYEELLENLTILRDYSFLGLKFKGKIDFKYRENISYQVTNQSNFIVHFGFRKYLNLG